MLIRSFDSDSELDWARLTGPLTDTPAHPADATVVAEEAGLLIGAGVIWTNDAHPSYRSAFVAVRPGFRRRGVGALLVSELQRRAAPHPLKASVWLDDEATLGFVRRWGLAELYRCDLVEIDPAEPSVRLWCREQTARVGPAEDTAELRHAAVAFYRRVHPTDPVPDPAPDWMGPDLLADHVPESLVIMRDDSGRIAAIGMSHCGEPGRELGMTGAIDSADPDAARMTGAVLAHQIRTVPFGQRLELEVDSTDLQLCAAVARFRHQVLRSLLKLVLEPVDDGSG